MKRKTNWRLIIAVTVLVVVAITALTVSLWLFMSHFGKELVAHVAHWGLLGDFIGGVVGTIFAGLTLAAVAWTVYEQSRHVEEQQRQTREIFLSSQRPWLMIRRIEFIDVLRVATTGVQVTIKLTLKNVGNSPALSVHADPKLALASRTRDPIGAHQAAIVKHEVERNSVARPNFGQTVFPGTEHAISISFGVSADEVEKASELTEPSAPVIFAYIQLHIKYHAAFQGAGRHLTAALFEIRRNARPVTPGRSETAIFLDDDNVPPKDLQLIVFPIGDYAD